MKTTLSCPDDFSLSPGGSLNAAEFYESFLVTEELSRNLEKKHLGPDPDLAFCGLLKEVHLAKSVNPALFRARADANQALMMLWLSRVREVAKLFTALNGTEFPPFNGLTQDDLVEISKLSRDIANLPNIAGILLQRGIVLIYERSLPGMKSDGAVFSLSEARPVIALSLRYPRLDIFWFTLMHELAHVVLHYDKLNVPILENIDEVRDDLVEQEADRLASNSLISRSYWRSCRAKYSLSEQSVYEASEELGIHPAIIAGRLQKELNRHDIFSKIVNEVDVRKVLLRND